MVQYSNGFSMMELYKMPTYLRMFYYNKLVEAKQRESDQHQAAQKKSESASKVRIKR